MQLSQLLELGEGDGGELKVSKFLSANHFAAHVKPLVAGGMCAARAGLSERSKGATVCRAASRDAVYFLNARTSTL